MTLSLVIFAIGCLSITFVNADDGNIYLPPLRNDSAPEKLIVFVPGGLVPPEDYVPTVKSIQSNTNARLWGVVVYCLANLCDPLVDLDGKIQTAISNIQAMGFSSTATSDIFIVGHSLGGVGARHYIDTYSGYAGLGLYGTQTNGDHEDLLGTLGYPLNLTDFQTPLLALVGELDFVPISHVAILYQEYLQLSQSRQYLNPVVVVPGMSHSAFCPGFYVSGDIKQEIDEKVALQIIGQVTGAWITLLSYSSPPQAAYYTLSKWNTTTYPLLAGYLTAMTTESASWCSFAQQTLSGLSQDDIDKLDISVQTVSSSLQLTNSHTSYTLNGDSLAIQLVNFPYYEGGFLPKNAGALELGCKALTAERIAQQLNLDPSTVNFNVTCEDVNQISLQTASSLLSKFWPNALQRFSKQGKTFSLEADVIEAAGPLWVFASLNWNEGPNSVSISSPALKTDLNGFFYPGNHYCKLVSPVRAMEWIMTQGLTQRYP